MDNRQATLELGTKPVGKLLMQYALPAIIAMTASSLYNMIDSIFIGQGVGPLAISGLAITFPLMNLSAAFGAAVGIGSSTCISVKLGQKDYRMAERIFGNSVTLNVIIGFAFSIVALIFLDPILYFFGASDNTIVYAREYMYVILGGNIFSHMFFGMNAILRAAGKPRHAMYATIFTVVMNIVLAPIFIWGAGLGIQGAAFATILAQTMALAWQLKLFSNKNEILHFRPGIYKMKKDIIKNIVSIGISPFSMNVCACIVVIFINTGLAHYGGDLAVGAYGIANRVAFIFVMLTMGVNQGMLPHCRIQLRGAEVRPSHEGAQICPDSRNGNYHDGISRRTHHPLSVCAAFHYRPHADKDSHESHADQHAGLSFGGRTDGDNQLLPEHRQSQDKHFPVAVETDAVPRAAAYRPAAYRWT